MAALRKEATAIMMAAQATDSLRLASGSEFGGKWQVRHRQCTRIPS
jgi:hypothetical protein